MTRNPLLHRRLWGAAIAAALVAPGVAHATQPEVTYIATPGWIPTAGAVGAGTVKEQHPDWHVVHGGIEIDGEEFLRFHREYIAQFDDWRLYTINAATTDPWPAIIPHVAGDDVKPAHTSANNFARAANHDIDAPNPHADGNRSQVWELRPASLKLGNPTFHGFATTEAIGDGIERTPITVPMSGLFHGGGHMTIGGHDRVDFNSGDMSNTTRATSDGAFWQWHRNIDEIYGDWAIGRYRKQDNSGLPHLFSVAPGALGAAGSELEVRESSDVYRSGGPGGSQFGAKPRVASDIYVAADDSKNLLFQYGIRKWSSPPSQDTTKFWNIDGYSSPNSPQSAFYFAVTPGSVGKNGTAVNGHAHRGGDIYTTPLDTTNALHRAEARLGLFPQTFDDLDGVEVDRGRRIQSTNDDDNAAIYDRTRTYFSLKTDSLHGLRALFGGGDVVVGGADILHFDDTGALRIAARAVDLGLAAAAELDAFTIEDLNGSDALDVGDKVYLSLAAGSASPGGDSPADIFVVTLEVGTRTVHATADDLGLLATDDVDALDLWDQVLFTGACCDLFGVCTNTTLAGCFGSGTYQGHGTDCAYIYCGTVPGACCHLDGSREDNINDLTCEQSGGTFQGGEGCSATWSPAPPRR